MSILATETTNGYTIEHTDAERVRAKTRATPPNSRDVTPPRRSVDLPRSASHTYLGRIRDRGYTNTSVSSIAFSDVGFTGKEGDTVDITPPESTGSSTPDECLPEVGINAARGRQPGNELQREPQSTVQTLAEATDDGRSSTKSSVKYRKSSLESSHTVSTAPTTPGNRRSVTSNFSRKLNGKSWAGSAHVPPPRPPSPQKKEIEAVSKREDVDATSTSDLSSTKRSRSFIMRRNSSKPRKENEKEMQSSIASTEQVEESIKHRPSLLRRKTTRPVSGLFKGSSNGEEGKLATPKPSRRAYNESMSSPTVEYKTSVTSWPKRKSIVDFPKSFSTDKLTSIPVEQYSTDRAVPVPRLLSSERIAKSSLAVPKKKDELWSAFRALDVDFSKFASKSVALKANVVRSNLLPFLRTYATHPSNRTLRPEDLDRRANILNKWWTGLIELLHGRNNLSISGTDRPAILDGISGVMERTEWRLPPSPFCPLNQRMKGTASPGSRSTTSFTSEASEFLAESVHHNVRNIFVQNLSAQMAFVVDKMSQRNAAASLVSFCGKACAYAFMFVPGMADVLVRLWDLRVDTLRRVLEGNGVGKFDNLSDITDIIVSAFPPALHQLGFSSLTKYMRKLRTPPSLPLGTANFQWWGRWLDRWTGRESDLFYVFAKYFHILVMDFLPLHSSKEERLCAPGFLLVHAQILTNLDATIHREENQTQQDSTTIAPSPTFDDVLGNPDAVASALPVPPNNATRLMAENRLIMLIRDFLSERAAEYPVARQLFAESFSNLLQTAARGTSMFDHAACYTLLDFLEEALVLLVRFENLIESGGSLVDIDFWKIVWKRMISSENTMTEVRLYAFIYTVWNNVICGLGRKADICDDILLNPEIFESSFNHWCPMVRAYFFRLLCWRVGRYDGEASKGDIAIFETMLERLQTSWSYYLFLREQSQLRDTLAPPTNPCNPAPSRRLLIVRTDPHANPPTAFLSFDGIMSPRSPADVTPQALKRNSTISHVIEIDTRPGSSLSMASDLEPESRGRGIGGFFRSLVSSKSRSKSRGPSQANAEQDAPPVPLTSGRLRSATDDFQNSTFQVLKETPSAVDKPTQVIKPRNFSFKFSLEYQPNARPLPPMRLFSPKLPMPAQQLLQTCTNKANPSSSIRAVEPVGESKARARYCGRALAEWALVLGECQSFFERRKNEGIPSNKFVETPTLGIEVFRRPV